MPTTSNFGWTTPADTDLVKDGAAAIRTLGNGIDTSFIDLKGGTTGQVLSKASNTDLDYSWVTPNVGDITEVQAGTGISIASGTGPIPVVTNTVATAYDAKGDLIVGTGADTFARLAYSATNNQILTIDTSTSTGLKWADAPAGGFTFAAYTPTYTNFTLGNGSVIARYAQSGKLVFFQVQVTFGSTTSVSGLIKISLPVTAKNNGNAVTIPALYTDAGLNEYIGFGSINQADNVVSLFAQDASATYLKYALTSNTVPFTWGNADVINVSGSYEAD